MKLIDPRSYNAIRECERWCKEKGYHLIDRIICNFKNSIGDPTEELTEIEIWIANEYRDNVLISVYSDHYSVYGWLEGNHYDEISYTSLRRLLDQLS